MNQELVSKFIGGAVIGMIALALDYFLLQHFVRTPVRISGGIAVWVVLIYLFVPFLVLQFTGREISGERDR